MAALSHHSNLNMFAPPNPNGMGGPPGAPNHTPYHIPPHYHQQPAPRQRTAIACRYCRRRKIRCSGFETSPDGRCANCMRFNQECVFTPVSSQPGAAIQAFVPAHTIRRHPGGDVQLYGAQGQPLPPSFTAGYTHPSVAHDNSSPFPVHPNHNNGDHPYPHRDDRSRGHAPPPPPPPPPIGHGSYARRGSAEDYSRYAEQPPSPSSHLPAPGHAFPPPLNGSSSTYSPSYGHGPSPPPSLPAVSGSFYPALPNPTVGQRPDSPGSRRSSGEPSVSPQPHPTFHPPMVYPPRETSAGPSSPGGPIPSMQVSNLIDPSQHPNPQHHQRSAADGEMLQRLNYRTGI